MERSKAMKTTQRKRTYVYLKKTQLNRINKASSELNISKSNLISGLIDEYLSYWVSDLKDQKGFETDHDEFMNDFLSGFSQFQSSNPERGTE